MTRPAVVDRRDSSLGSSPTPRGEWDIRRDSAGTLPPRVDVRRLDATRTRSVLMGLVESDAYPETTPLPETWREVAENRPVDFFRWFCAPQVRQDASGGVSVRQAGTYVSHVGEVRVGVDKRDVLDAVRRSSARLWKPKAGSGRYMKYSFPPPDGDSGDASRIRRVYYAVSLLGAITGDLGPYRDFHVACSEGRGVRSSIASARDACGRMGWTLVDKPRPSGPFEPRHLYAFRNCALAVESLR